MSLRSPFKLIVLLGLVSLFADFTYEGARSIMGPYLATLGASATLVGFVAGLGEFLGYGLRLFSGYLSDRIKNYWAFTIFGYFVNLLSIPALALAKTPFQAAGLFILERMGKAIRTPARDTILSFATARVGRGKGFGIHEAMDQIGAIAGPLFVSLLLFYFKDYRLAFAGLIASSLLAIAFLLISYFLYFHPQELEKKAPKEERIEKLPTIFWLYALSMGIYGAGFADFALMAYHFHKEEILGASSIPLYYALAMAIDALSALFFGFLFDKRGLKVLIFPIFFSALAPPLVFLGKIQLLVFLGLFLWGIALGAQESIMRASVALFTPKEKRATAYGLFHALFGFLWFLGSLLLGILYDFSLYALVSVSTGLQLLSIPLLIRVIKIYASAKLS